MTIVSIGRNDTWPPLRAQVTDDRGYPLDITGVVSVTFTMRKSGASVDKVLDAAGVVEDAETGIIYYAWAVGDTDESGVFNAQFEVTLPSGKFSVPNRRRQTLRVEIGPDLNGV